MPEDNNIELLETIHELQSTSTSVVEALDVAIARADGSTIVVPVGMAEAIQLLLRIQSKALANLAEQNQEIVDQIYRLTERFK